MHRVELHRAAARQVARIKDRATRKAVAVALKGLREDPRPDSVVKLKGSRGLLYRLRAGDWRIVYSVLDRKLLVLVVQVGNRRDAYDNLDVLLARVDEWLRRLKA